MGYLFSRRNDIWGYHGTVESKLMEVVDQVAFYEGKPDNYLTLEEKKIGALLFYFYGQYDFFWSWLMTDQIWLTYSPLDYSYRPAIIKNCGPSRTGIGQDRQLYRLCRKPEPGQVYLTQDQPGLIKEGVKTWPVSGSLWFAPGDHNHVNTWRWPFWQPINAPENEIPDPKFAWKSIFAFVPVLLKGAGGLVFYVNPWIGMGLTAAGTVLGKVQAKNRKIEIDRGNKYWWTVGQYTGPPLGFFYVCTQLMYPGIQWLELDPLHGNKPKEREKHDLEKLGIFWLHKYHNISLGWLDFFQNTDGRTCYSYSRFYRNQYLSGSNSSIPTNEDEIGFGSNKNYQNIMGASHEIKKPEEDNGLQMLGLGALALLALSRFKK